MAARTGTRKMPLSPPVPMNSGKVPGAPPNSDMARSRVMVAAPSAEEEKDEDWGRRETKEEPETTEWW